MPVAKGSHNSWKAKLTPKEALKAYQLMRHYKWTAVETAKHFGVARTTMLSIRNGGSWAWLTEHNKKGSRLNLNRKIEQ